MSHFSTIKTKITKKPALLEALQLLQYDVKEDQELTITNPDHRENHPVVHAEVVISEDIGFRWNETTESYDLYCDRGTWNLDVPVERFIQKVTQQYARMTIHNQIKNDGFEVLEEWEMDDNSIELVVTRWN